MQELGSLYASIHETIESVEAGKMEVSNGREAIERIESLKELLK
jgi:hypothetical protein